MRTHMMHMLKAQNSPGTPAGESRRTWRAYRPRKLARVGGGSAAARVARLREYHSKSHFKVLSPTLQGTPPGVPPPGGTLKVPPPPPTLPAKVQGGVVRGDVRGVPWGAETLAKLSFTEL